MEAHLAATGEQATHTAFDSHTLAVLEMSLVDRTIEAIAEQVLQFFCMLSNCQVMKVPMYWKGVLSGYSRPHKIIESVFTPYQLL